MQIELTDLFLSTDIWGLFGPFAMVLFGIFVISNPKYKPIGVLWIIVEFIALAKYFDLLTATPFYWWNIIILVLGVIISVFQLSSR